MIAVLSYNMKGFRNGADYLNDVIYQEQPDIVCLQETWHLENACDHIENLNDNYYFIEQSGVDSRSSIISGRPHGGVAILYKKTLGNNVGKIDTKCKRICALRIKSSDELNDIVVVSLYIYAMRHTKCVTMCRWISRCHAGLGDIVEWSWWCSCCNLWRLEHWSFTKKNAQTEYSYAFTAHNDLELCWNHPVSKRDYTYVNHGLQHRSCIDHFVMSRKVFQHITACYVYESPVNPSDHNDIFLRLQWNFNFTQCSDRHHATGNIAWHRVAAEHIEQYKDVLNGVFEQTELTDSVLYCTDKCCTDELIGQISISNVINW